MSANSSLMDLAERWVIARNSASPSANTMSARGSDLRVIAGHLSTRKEVPEDLRPSDLTVGSLELAIGDYAVTHAATSTRRVISTWKQFCLWLVRERQLESNPMDHIDGPRRTPWVPKPLQPADLKAVAEACSSPGPTERHPWPERDEVLFALLIAAGVRISEAIQLQIGDCYLEDDPQRLRIRGRGDKWRDIPIPPEATARLLNYLPTRDLRAPRQVNDTLLIRPDGRPLTRSAADHLVRGWFKRAGCIPPKGSLAHSFRHTYATMLVDNGASLPEVQQLLGHADLATTQAYLAVTATGLTEAMMANPARKLL